MKHNSDIIDMIGGGVNDSLSMQEFSADASSLFLFSPFSAHDDILSSASALRNVIDMELLS